MIVRMGILRKKENLTPEAFRKQWLEGHGPIAAKIPGLRRYYQNHVVDSAQLGIDYPRSPQTVDGFSQLWFDDLSSMQGSVTPDIIKILAEDEARFVGHLQLIVAKQNVVVPTADDNRLIKRMSLLKRRPDVDAVTFEREWWEVHSELVRSMPGIEGYTQDLVIERSIERGKSASYEEVSIDGIVELWFRDIPSLEAAFASPAGHKAQAHARTFIGEITTFLVETHRIV